MGKEEENTPHHDINFTVIYQCMDETETSIMMSILLGYINAWMRQKPMDMMQRFLEHNPIHQRLTKAIGEQNMPRLYESAQVVSCHVGR